MKRASLELESPEIVSMKRVSGNVLHRFCVGLKVVDAPKNANTLFYAQNFGEEIKEKDLSFFTSKKKQIGERHEIPCKRRPESSF